MLGANGTEGQAATAYGYEITAPQFGTSPLCAIAGPNLKVRNDGREGLDHDGWVVNKNGRLPLVHQVDRFDAILPIQAPLRVSKHLLGLINATKSKRDRSGARSGGTHGAGTKDQMAR